MQNETIASEITISMKRSFIRFPHVQQLLVRLDELRQREWVEEEPDNLFLLGEAGVGKSRLLEKFRNTHPRIVHEEFTEIPILYVKVPPRGNISGLASAMLLELGSPFLDRGTTIQLTHQLICLLRTCKVKVIVLDELNHLVDKGGIKTHHHIADWLKQLSDLTRIPFVLSGIPRAARLLQTNDQMRSRFREVITIKPFSVENDLAKEDFCKVLQTFSKMIKDIPKVDLIKDDLPQLMVFATAGRLRDIRRLLVRAVQLAFDQPSPKITIQTLASAFRQVIFPDAPDHRNPFCKDFKKIPLTGINEPFAPREE